MLNNARDNVLARTAHGLVRFHRAQIPSDLHTRGRLAYVALREVPHAVIVRAPSGRTVLTESLHGMQQAARERCAGEAES